MKMKFTRKGLSGVIKRAASVSASNGLLEILSHFLVEVRDGVASFTATNMEMQITATAPVHATDEAVFTLPAKKFVALVATFPADAEISLELVGERATLRCGKGRYVLDGLDPKNFPAIAVSASGAGFQAEAPEFRRTLDFVMPSMAWKDVRNYLNGALITVGSGGLVAVSTDGHRIAVRQFECPGDDVVLLLSNNGINTLHGLLADCGTCQVQVEKASNAAVFTLGDYRLVAKLIDGSFPDWRRLMPDKPGYVEVNRAGLVEILKRLSLFSSEKNFGVKLNFGGSELQATTGGDNGDTAVESIPFTGDLEHTTGINLRYLIDAMDAVDSELVEIGAATPGLESSAMVVRPIGNNQSRIVLMPMRM